MAQLTIAEALRKAIRDEMRKDETVFCLGEDIGVENGWGGAFTITKGLSEEFGHDRIIDTPIAEILIGGGSVGAAMAGMRPIADLQYGDFIFCMASPLINEAAKMCYMSGGKVKVPMVLRAPVGATTRGAQHAQSLEGYFTHCPGLKVICPSNAYDAKGLLTQAIRDDNPVICFEHKLLYGNKGYRVEKTTMSPTSEVPDDDYVIEFGRGKIKREGKDVTIVANLLMIYRSLEAAEILEKEGISVEIIDPRTLVPFDYDMVYTSVKKTGKLLIVHEDTLTNGWGSEVAARVAQDCLYDLDAPIRRLATMDTPIPCATLLEQYVLPSVDNIVDTVREMVKE